MHTKIFNVSKFCDLLDTIIEQNIYTDIDKLCENYISGNLITGKKIKNNDLIGENIVTHGNVNIIIDYIYNKYKLNKKTLFNIRINIIINMYEKILRKIPDTINFLGSCPNNMLFKMDKFWNNYVIDNLVHNLPNKESQIIQKIQYLASCCKQSLTTDKYECFIIDDLVLENEIIKYINTEL